MFSKTIIKLFGLQILGNNTLSPSSEQRCDVISGTNCLPDTYYLVNPTDVSIIYDDYTNYGNLYFCHEDKAVTCSEMTNVGYYIVNKDIMYTCQKGLNGKLCKKEKVTHTSCTPSNIGEVILSNSITNTFSLCLDYESYRGITVDLITGQTGNYFVHKNNDPTINVFGINGVSEEYAIVNVKDKVANLNSTHFNRINYIFSSKDSNKLIEMNNSQCLFNGINEFENNKNKINEYLCIHGYCKDIDNEIELPPVNVDINIVKFNIEGKIVEGGSTGIDINYVSNEDKIKMMYCNEQIICQQTVGYFYTGYKYKKLGFDGITDVDKFNESEIDCNDNIGLVYYNKTDYNICIDNGTKVKITKPIVKKYILGKGKAGGVFQGTEVSNKIIELTTNYITIKYNPKANDKVYFVGMWYEFLNEEGTYNTGDEYVNYIRIGQAINFNDNGKGYFVTLLFENEGDEPIEVLGGKDFGPFTYTATANGDIDFKFGGNTKYSNYYKTFTLNYEDGCIFMKNDENNFKLSRSPDEITEMIQLWDSVVNGNDYNINNKKFRRNNWRDQEYIYIYDGKGSETDKMGRSGYKREMLPWSADKQTNLPSDFCNDITPENGWELAINLFGDRNHENNNFFALYNKYTGILRFFYYMPTNFQSGNDHHWEISMTDNMAHHSLWKYGLTSDKTVQKAYKKLLNQNSNKEFVLRVTPYYRDLSNDGIIKPNSGWWAFDVDLSIYRPGADFSNDEILLKMNSWNTQHESFTRFIIGTTNYDKIKSSISVNSANGLCTNVNSVFEFGSDFFDSLESFLEIFDNKKEKKRQLVIATAISYITFAMSVSKGAFSLYQELTEDEDENENDLEGNIIFGLTDNIDTQKVIQMSTINNNIYTPNFKMEEKKIYYPIYGVWNLEKPPVVYRSKFSFDRLTKKDKWYTKEKKSIVNPYFFDPSSIKVQLNPDVFPEDQIEWMEIDSICKANFTMQTEDNNQLRYFYGLNSINTDETFEIIESDDVFNFTDPLFDFLYEFDNKMGMINDYQEELGESILKGRGKEKSWIEPMILDKKSIKIPLLEVNVYIRFKMKNSKRIFHYNRNYLPEYKFYNPYDFFESSESRKSYIKNTKLYDYQMKRISDICSLYNLGIFSPGRKYMIPIKGSGNSEREGYYFLVDGNPKTKWSTDEMKDGVYFVEFKALKPIIPQAYRLTTSYDIKKNPKRIPKSWKLMAKVNNNDMWTTISTVTDDNSLPTENTNTIVYDLDIKGGKYEYFRFEVSKVNGDQRVELGYIELDE